MRPIEEVNPKSLEIMILANSNKTNRTQSDYRYFNCTEFLWYQVKIDIIFYEPLYVSHNGIDMVYIKVKNGSLFTLNDTNLEYLEEMANHTLDSVPKNYQMISKIPK